MTLFAMPYLRSIWGMVTINLNIHYDLEPEDRLRLRGRPLGKYEMEKDIVEHCIIPALERYIPDLQKRVNVAKKKSRKKKGVE